MPGDVDLAAYFKRIGFGARPAADLATLAALHGLHPIAIPFENLSAVLREPIPLDIPALEDKLVARGRGGYCFEHNTLFGAVLRTIGFEVVGLAARVVWGRRAAGPPGPRSHMVLRVRAGGEDYISDVGFGGLTLTGPLKLELDTEQETPHERFRLRRIGDELELEARVQGDWRPLYRFDLQIHLPIDFDVLNHFVATHPSSHFLTTLIAARRTADGRFALSNNDLAVYRGTAKEERKLRSGAEIARVLTEEFRIALPRGQALDSKLAAFAAQ
jgi:N-hydroxyarylamine O-acetyltransferase